MPSTATIISAEISTPVEVAVLNQVRTEFIESKMHLVEPIALRLAPSLGRNGHFDLDDLVSEGTLALIQAVDRFDPALGEFDAYASKCIAGAIQNYDRRATNSPVTLVELRDDVADSADDFANAFEQREHLQGAIERAVAALDADLSTERSRLAWARQREAIELRIGEQATFLAIAVQLGISPDASAMLLKRGLDALRPYLLSELRDED